MPYHTNKDLPGLKAKQIIDMDFKEFFTGYFNTDFLLPEEIETICKAAELYAEAKLKNYLKKDQ